ncbi:hypothetical protein Taro_047851, partial [Colocasia esculenta]|nr:hypothetical protein [Colocasia esculenta]
MAMTIELSESQMPRSLPLPTFSAPFAAPSLCWACKKRLCYFNPNAAAALRLAYSPDFGRPPVLQFDLARLPQLAPNCRRRPLVVALPPVALAPIYEESDTDPSFEEGGGRAGGAAGSVFRGEGRQRTWVGRGGCGVVPTLEDAVRRGDGHRLVPRRHRDVQGCYPVGAPTCVQLQPTASSSSKQAFHRHPTARSNAVPPIGGVLRRQPLL